MSSRNLRLNSFAKTLTPSKRNKWRTAECVKSNQLESFMQELIDEIPPGVYAQLNASRVFEAAEAYAKILAPHFEPGQEEYFGLNGTHTDKILEYHDKAMGFCGVLGEEVWRTKVRQIACCRLALSNAPAMAILVKELMGDVPDTQVDGLVATLQSVLSNEALVPQGFSNQLLSLGFDIDLRDFTASPDLKRSGVIVLGDGMLDFQSNRKEGSLAIHENHAWANSRYVMMLFGKTDPLTSFNETSCWCDLDTGQRTLSFVLTGYYFAHERGMNMNKKDLCNLYEIAYNDGGCGSDEYEKLTSAQRACVYIHGTKLAKQDKKKIRPKKFLRKVQCWQKNPGRPATHVRHANKAELQCL